MTQVFLVQPAGKEMQELKVNNLVWRSDEGNGRGERGALFSNIFSFLFVLFSARFKAKKERAYGGSS